MEMNVKLADPRYIGNEFRKICKQLDINPREEDIRNLVVFDMTDGTRTSTRFKGSDAYVDGGLFVIRLLHTLKSIGVKNAYVNVIDEKHKERVNYEDIYMGLRRLTEIYRNFANENKYRLRFLGDYKYRIEPMKILQQMITKNYKKSLRGVSKENVRKYIKELEKKYKEKKVFDFRKVIKQIEKETSKNKDFTAYFLINYSTQWAARKRKKIFKKMPNVNAILRHTKGYVGGDMWIYDKFDKNTFVYVQNGSSNYNWSDRQLLYLVAISLRSAMVNGGFHQSKVYHGNENEMIKKVREKELTMIHKNLYNKNLESKMPKRIVIFSAVGPEIYEF